MSPIDGVAAVLSWSAAALILHAEAVTSIPGDEVLGFWDRLIVIWNSGNGLAFVLFIALALFFTGRLVSGRDAERRVKEWETRYKENDDRWRERFQEQKNRADSSERMLYQLMGTQARTVTVAERAATAAEVVAASSLNSGGEKR